MAKLADAADLKFADLNRSWGFKSPSGHQLREVPRLRSEFRWRAQTPAKQLKFKSPSGYHPIKPLSAAEGADSYFVVCTTGKR